MATYNLVADVSSHQPDTPAFFQRLKNVGVKAVIVKITEGSNPGTAYINPKAKNQIKNARECGMKVHAYHFARFSNDKDAVHEAMWFILNAKKMGIMSDSVMVVDVETPEIPHHATSSVNEFLRTVISAGYHKTDIYTSASWIWEGRVNPDQLIAKNLWIAAHNNKQPGVDNVGTWQFTDNYMNMNVDMSYDFFEHYTGDIIDRECSDAYYTVVSGDSWWGIAHKFNVDMYDLAKLNGKTIKSVIHPGDQLRIK